MENPQSALTNFEIAKREEIEKEGDEISRADLYFVNQENQDEPED
jgi:hypothetical protein